jgi:hypothetical protein
MKVTGGLTITFGLPGIEPELKEPDMLDCLLDNAQIRWDSKTGWHVRIAGQEIKWEVEEEVVWGSIKDHIKEMLK